MIDVLSFLAPPFAACLVLVGILGYFGIHVLRRGVIFVDLALAQIVALGAIVSFLFGHEPGSDRILRLRLSAPRCSAPPSSAGRGCAAAGCPRRR